MSWTMSWLAPGILAIGGTLVGALIPFGLGVLNRRTERRRLSREQKVQTYPALVTATTRLATCPVWTSNRDASDESNDDVDRLYRQVEALAHQVAFFGPAQVGATLEALLGSARRLVDAVTRIRAESGPGHRNQVDQRLAPRHETAVRELTDAVSAFAAAGRADLEIAGAYTPIPVDHYQDDHLGRMGKLEPGAGSREPGAGSREPGAGSREPGAGSVNPRSLLVCHVG